MNAVENFVQHEVRWTDTDENFRADMMRDPIFSHIRAAVEKKSPKRLTLIERHNLAVEESKMRRFGKVSITCEGIHF